ncbi:glycerol-3-phosphate dehydrogenase/oxidase [Antarcticibacterium sp. 1MA-6-2]|uniref:glycerol-3-phosphate dehydrogenase/oxidase n=1 Tax=Antarcticibacterium sp. 1MA-6-2 TaxID=2908210 RepID=UPI001F369E85|nr:glycerol-3-phosphate dehydrogenase/oxidase [Antarcticibacterium sp. 1MA-6-2]UJH90609.1 glycerol-3-phosphate dehydrogenase/oxidase [Antarcticibacterium sp. 1MA-6-2]
MKKEIKENSFDREGFLQIVKDPSILWDIIIVGGGATGLGVALDAASRGFKTLLLEQADFSSGTSSRSTKLAHGGVRYLAQGNISLVNEALYERGLMLKNAPHLVKLLPFIIPSYNWWGKYFYGIGLKIYDWMARKLRMGKTVLLKSREVKEIMPDIKKTGLNGGVLYFDGQFDDSRLAINLAQTSAENGGVLLNYMKVTSLIKDDNGKISGVTAQDVINGEEFTLKSKMVINATGVFVDKILKMNSDIKDPIVTTSQGIHLVLDRSFFRGDHALMIPSTSDGRVLFAVPWHGHLLVGTTDTPLDSASMEPVALESEISFVLKNLSTYLEKKPEKKDILSVFAGLRPLVVPEKEKGTKEISRDHKLMASPSNLITITGGKWTTYRKMAEDTVDEAIKIGNLDKKACRTMNLKIHGNTNILPKNSHLDIYGSDLENITKLIKNNSELNAKLHPEFPNIKAEIVWIVQNEMVVTLEDVLARRLRVLFLNAKAAIEMAPEVAHIMAEELKKDSNWELKEVKKFTELAQNYLPEPYYPPVPATKTESPKLKKI